MGKDKRGYGTMIVATTGLLGAVAAYYFSELLAWRNAYIAGGVMGLLLLLMRIGTFESKMFREVQQKNGTKGNIMMLFQSKERFLRYLYCLLIGLPTWFVVGILITQAPEFGKALDAPVTLSAGKGILYSYIGIALGDVVAGLLAQFFKSRRLVVFIFQIATLIVTIFYLKSKEITESQFHTLAFLMGLAVGYWATFVTIAAEQFGTNLRATVTTTAPNFARGSLIPITFLFEFFVRQYNIITAAFIIIVLITIVAAFAVSRLKESFNKDLNYIES